MMWRLFSILRRRSPFAPVERALLCRKDT